MDNLKAKTRTALLWNAGGVGGRQATQLVIGILLARLLAPAEFGLMAMLNVFVAVAGVFVEGGFGAALIHRKHSTPAEESSVLFMNVGLSLVGYALLWFAAPWVAAFFSEEILTPLLRVVGLSLVFTAPGIVQSSLLSRALDFRRRTQVIMAASLLSGLLAVALAWRGWGVWSLAIQMVANALLSSIFYWWASAWRPIFRFDPAGSRELGVYGVRLVGSHVLNSLFENIQHVLIGRFYTKTDLGLYSRALSFQQLPVQAYAQAISGVSFPALVHLNENPDAFRRGYHRALTLSMAGAFPMMGLLLVLAEPLFRLVLSDTWVPAVPYFQIFCLSGMLYPWHLLNVNLILAGGRPDLYLRLELAKRLVGLTVTLIMLPFGVLALAWGLLISGLIALAINSIYAGRLMQYPFVAQLKDVIGYFGASCLAVGAVWSTIPLLPDVDVVRIAVGGALFVAISGGLGCLVRDNAYRYAWSQFKNKA